MKPVRTRIAPSPTGLFHIGNAKTALYNWLLARKTGGTFILRLEDTDVGRSKSEYAEIICEALTWLGIDWDEGPAFRDRPESGDCGPYRQSERLDKYSREVQRLIDEGKAYKCFATKEEIEAEHQRARQEKRPPARSKWRHAPPEKVEEMGDAPYVVRFKAPDGKTVIDDVVQGTVEVDNREVDDFVIVKPNGEPVFHLAVVVDDGLMGVTHVIRGDDHLTNAAKHVMLFEAFGYDLPVFAHHPLVHDEHGKKYSKRLHGANVLDWRRDGYLPEALVNYLALLGWAPGDDREVFTREELIESFSLERLTQSAGRFDIKKLQWLNGRHIRMLSVGELRDRVIPILESAGLDVHGKSPEWLNKMTSICREKLRTLNDIVPFTDFFFIRPADYEDKAARKHWDKDGALELMEQLLQAMKQTEPWNADELKSTYESLAEKNGVGLGKLIHPTRLALTGKSVGPGLFELAELMGKDECLARMDRAIEVIGIRQEEQS